MHPTEVYFEMDDVCKAFGSEGGFHTYETVMEILMPGSSDTDKLSVFCKILETHKTDKALDPEAPNLDKVMEYLVNEKTKPPQLQEKEPDDYQQDEDKNLQPNKKLSTKDFNKLVTSYWKIYDEKCPYATKPSERKELLTNFSGYPSLPSLLHNAIKANVSPEEYGKFLILSNTIIQEAQEYLIYLQCQYPYIKPILDVLDGAYNFSNYEEECNKPGEGMCKHRLESWYKENMNCFQQK